MLRRLRKFLISEEGATAVEYALIVSLIALAAVGGMMSLGEGVVQMWTNVAGQVALG